MFILKVNNKTRLYKQHLINAFLGGGHTLSNYIFSSLILTASKIMPETITVVEN